MLGIKEGGEHQQFLPKIFCLIASKFSQDNPFVQCFRSFPVAKKFLNKGGGAGYQDFPSKKFSSQCRKFRRATLWCSVSEIFR